MEVLNNVDQFGIRMQIKVFGKDKHTSKLGGIITLLALALFSLIFYYMGADLWQFRNPSVVPNEVVHENAQFINLSNGEYPFMMNLSFFDGYNTPNKGYRLLAEYSHNESDENGNRKSVCYTFRNILSDCKETSIKKLDYYKEKDISNYKCIDFKKIETHCREQTKDPKYEVELGGGFSDRINKGLKLSVVNFTFDESRQFTNIATEADLYPSKLTHFNLRMPSIALNNQLPENPLQTISVEENTVLHKDTVKLQWKFFKMVTFLDDKGWLTESTHKTQSIEKDRETTDFLNSNVFNSDIRYFYQTLILLNSKEQEHHRRYLKIQDVIAISSSFMKGIASFCWIYVLYQGQKQLDKKLVENVFKVEIKQMHSKTEEIKTNSIVSTAVIAKRKEKTNKPGFFARCFCWCRQSATNSISNENLASAISYINSKIEVTAIVRMFEDFEKLKEILLSEEQMKELEVMRRIHLK